MESERSDTVVKLRKNDHGENGMTIIELVVAMTISLMLMTVLFKFLSDQTSSFVESRQTSEMQQELRWAITFVSDHVKLAGNGVPPTCGWPVIANTNGDSGASDSLSVLGCYKNLMITTTQPMGNEGSQIKVDNTDGMEIGDLCVITDGTFQEIFMVTDIITSHLWHQTALPWNDDSKLDHRYVQNSSVSVVSHYSFFVDTDDEGHSNLMLKSQAYDPQILIGDVDNFQIRFKMKDGTWLDEPGNDEIYDIRMVEVTVRAKTPKELKNYVDPIYGDAYKRIEFKSVVIPKNITII